MERPHRHPRRPARAGFTLIELLVAILIIAALLAILLPALAGAFRRAKEAQVSAEINNMATALASFKSTYGDFPPSRVLLCEGGYTAAILGNVNSVATLTAYAPSDSSVSGASQYTDMSIGQLATRSLGYLRKFWPRADYMTVPSSPALGTWNDFNGNRNVDAYYILNGSECLAFFLGGIPTREVIGDATSAVTGVTGFSKSPKYPFVDNGTVTNGTVTTTLAPNRTVPNYEFNNGRLVDLDADGIPSYLDPLDLSPDGRRGYAYFSAYGVNSYDPNDCNGFGNTTSASSPSWESEDDGSNFIERGFSVSFPPNSVISPAPNPYTASTPVTTNQAWINANSFQLFSAGQDRQFGLGGTYKQNSGGGNGVLPILPIGSDVGNIHNDDLTGVRVNRESDNVTNFSGGRIQ